MRFIQHVVELIKHLKAGAEVRSTESLTEYAKPEPPAAEVEDTEGVIEWVKFPPNLIIYTAGVIEVAWPMPGPPEPPEPPGEPSPGGNDCMLILDLSTARETLPDYDPATVPDY
jgi:hypothetical protein